MKYFKNTEAANIYRVSEKAVRNWVTAAKAGKNSLELYEHNGRQFIANTTKNDAAIKKLVAKGQKFKNSLGKKIVQPTPEFYTTYSSQQVYDIFSNLDIRREIPLQYTYLKDGALYYDLYAKRLLNEPVKNTLNATDSLLRFNLEFIDYLLSDFKNVNVVDLGVGNAMLIKGLIEYLRAKNKLRRYIGIDISREMLTIAETNINQWFHGTVKIEKYVKDLNYDHFGHLIANDFYEESENTVNLVLLLGGTLSNMRQPSRVLRLINDSMGKDDIFIHSLKLDTEQSRRYFNFDARSESTKLDGVFGTVVRLLGIDESLYEVEQLYDSRVGARLVRIILNIDVELIVKVYSGVRHINMKKGEKITLWRARHQNANDVSKELESVDFDLLSANITPEREFMLQISKIKSAAQL